MALRILIILAAGYITVCACVYLMQRRLLYHPCDAAQSRDEVDAMGLAAWPGSGDSLRGYVNREVRGGRPGIVVVFHGNSGTAPDRGYYARTLGELNYRVLLAEYPAYGGRKGELSEKSLVADAKSTILLARRQFGGPVTIVGESLGCGVAAGAAADPLVPVDAILLITPWSTLPDLAREIYRFLPARWLVRDQFDNVQNLMEYQGPVAVSVAEYDEVIPVRFGLRLYNALRNKKRLWMLKSTGHNDWLDRAGTAWWREVMDFLETGVENENEG